MLLAKTIFAAIFTLVGGSVTAKDAIIDLTGSGTDTVFMSGDWNFVREQYVEPKNGQLFRDSVDKKYVMDVRGAGVWNHYYSPDWKFWNFWNFGEIGKGYGTYFTRVLVDDAMQCEDVSIQLDRIKLAYRLYIDGQLVMQHGKPGTTADTTEYLYYPQIVRFPLHADCHDFEIALHVANFIYTKGGIDDPIRIGIHSNLANVREIRISLRSLIVGIMLISAIISLTWYLNSSKVVKLGNQLYQPIQPSQEEGIAGLKHRFKTTFSPYYKPYQNTAYNETEFEGLQRRNRAHLVFSLVVIGWLIRTVTEAEKLINTYLPLLPPEYTLRFDLACVYFAWPLLIIYKETILPKSTSPSLYRANAIWMIVAFPLGLSSLYLSGYILEISHFYLLVTMTYLTISCGRYLVAHPRWFHLFLFLVTGGVCFATWNDILYEAGVFRSLGYLSNFAIAMYCLVNIALLGSDMVKLNDKRRESVIKLTGLARKEADTANKRLKSYQNQMSAVLHDEISTPVSLIKAQFNTIELSQLSESNKRKFVNAIESFDQFYRNIRNLSAELKPESELIDALSIGRALENLAQVQSTEKTQILTDIDFDFEDRIKKSTQKEAWAILQEAINNALNHAKANTIFIRVSCKEKFAQFSIIDDGVGIHEIDKAAKKGIGLQSMRYRATSNSFDIAIKPSSEGVTVTLTVPYDNHQISTGESPHDEA